jgi:FlaG/FlaF family flagellin (archaellin)
MNRLASAITAVVAVVLVAGISFAMLGGGASAIVDSENSNSDDAGQLQEFKLTDRTCDGSTYNNISNVPRDGREITINATVATNDVSQELDADLEKVSENGYRVDVTTSSSDTTEKDCAGVLAYRGKLTIPETSSYTVEVTHNDETAYVIESSGEKSGVTSHSSGASDGDTSSSRSDTGTSSL